MFPTNEIYSYCNVIMLGFYSATFMLGHKHYHGLALFEDRRVILWGRPMVLGRRMNAHNEGARVLLARTHMHGGAYM